MPNQRTIGKNVRFSGKALQTGHLVNVVCKPAEPETGIVFSRTDLPGEPVLRLSDAIFSDTRQRRSTIGAGPQAVQTVEHFLAALWGLSIDNITVEIDGPELPAMDGSALEFFKNLKNAGRTEQSPLRRSIKVLEKEKVEENGRSLAIMPADVFSVSYLIEYGVSSIGREVFDINFERDSFEKEIAPARTFCLKDEAEALLRAGLGEGATLKNTLVLDDSGPIGTEFRFPNEPVRHKILDLVGDLYMLGRPVIGRVVAERSGHGLNARMVKLLYEKYVKK